MEDFIKFVVAVLALVGAIIGISLLFALFVMVLWNAVMPFLFGVPELDIWKAWWLSMLCGFLFGSRSYSQKD